MSERTALVTGGNRGIGAGIVRSLAAEGYRVAFSHKGEPDKAASLIESIRADGWPVPVAFECDFASAGAVEGLAAASVRELGAITLLVNNAGRGYEERIQDLTLDDIESVYAINYRAPLLLMRDVGSHMIAHGVKGSVVNISSVKAIRGNNIDAVYGGLKAALERSTMSIALEFAPHGIRVNCIAPGCIAVLPHRASFYERIAPSIPLERTGTAEDIGRAVVFLASSDSSFITGTTLRVDGGHVLPVTYEGDDIGPDNRWGRDQMGDRATGRAVWEPVSRA